MLCADKLGIRNAAAEDPTRPIDSTIRGNLRSGRFSTDGLH